MVSAGGDRAPGQGRRRFAQQHSPSHARLDAEITVARVGAAQRGNMYLLRKDYDHAIDYYREIHERFPSGSKAAYAHWKCAWLTYLQRRKEQAKKVLRGAGRVLSRH